jgi:hypothetical protein
MKAAGYWVKASDRLPNEKIMEYGLGSIFIRNIQSHHGGMIYISELKKMDGLENVEWLDDTQPLPDAETERTDMTAREFFTDPGSPLTLDFLNPEEKDFLLEMIELYAKGKVHQAQQRTLPTTKEIADLMYKMYGTDSGILFGIADRSAVNTIIELVLAKVYGDAETERTEVEGKQEQPGYIERIAEEAFDACFDFKESPLKDYSEKEMKHDIIEAVKTGIEDYKSASTAPVDHVSTPLKHLSTPVEAVRLEGVEIKDWTEPINGEINVPDELDGLVNNFGFHYRIHAISKRTSEIEMVCRMVYAAQKFFTNKFKNAGAGGVSEGEAGDEIKKLKDIIKQMTFDFAVKLQATTLPANEPSEITDKDILKLYQPGKYSSYRDCFIAGYRSSTVAKRIE